MPEPQSVMFPPSQGVPNNPTLPVLLYRGVFPANASEIEARIDGNGWEARWRNGVYDFHHFHTTAHEALGVARGTARVLLGGEDGTVFDIEPGDMVILPAGTGHKRLSASADLLIVGAYPPGQDFEIERASATGLREALQRIANVPLPASDPATGKDGALTRLWKA